MAATLQPCRRLPVNVVVSLGVITLLFAMIYKVLPDVKLGWSDVWVGALVTAGLFTIGKFLIGLYLGTSRDGGQRWAPSVRRLRRIASCARPQD
jgi:uncharacterized BrkB/YihY/UPF0761 family membrane protein